MGICTGHREKNGMMGICMGHRGKDGTMGKGRDVEEGNETQEGNGVRISQKESKV